MSKITISEAAKQGYASRPTLYRHLRSGKVSAKKTKDGRTVLDEIELRRVYGNPLRLPNRMAAKVNVEKYEVEIVRLTSENVKLQSEVKYLKDTVKYQNNSIKNYKLRLKDENRRIDKLLDIIDRAKFDI